MTEIRYVLSEDKEFWYSLDKRLPEQEFDNFVQCYLLIEIIKGKGYGKKLMEHWEKDMMSQGYEQPMEMFLIKGI